MKRGKQAVFAPSKSTHEMVISPQVSPAALGKALGKVASHESCREVVQSEFELFGQGKPFDGAIDAADLFENPELPTEPNGLLGTNSPTKPQN
jgi:hypothetical protein